MRYARRLFVLLFLTLAAAGGEAQAQTTFTVDTPGTATHGSCSPGACTLPDAIVAANATAGADTIVFNLPGSGVQTIALDAALPTIGEAVTIDGYSQPGAVANSAVTGALDGTLRIEIIGTASYYNDGLIVAASNVVIRGLIFSGFINDLHLMSGTGIALQGCYLGTLPDGSAIASPTSDRGVLIEPAASATIGGSTAAARNLIAGHGLDGIRVDRGSGAVSTVVVAGNLIGTDRLGQAAIPNGTAILVETGAGTEAHTLTIGGSAAADGNIIAGNAVGIAIDRFAGEDTLSAVNTIQNNHLGVNATGTIIPNTGNAVAFTGPSMGLLSFNIIRGNGGAGVWVEGPTAAGGRGVLIVENSISENDGLAIDLGPVGRTPNDADDADTGANHLQNFPVLTRVTSTAGGTTYEGTLHSTPGSMFLIELYDNGTVDRPGRDSALMTLRTFVTTDANGLAAFTVGSPTIVPVGHYVSATISDGTGGTSEVSDNVRARPLGVRIGGTLTYNGTIAIGGATVTLSGAAAASTTTDAGGYYEFDGLTPGGSYTVTPALDGYAFVPASQTIPVLISDSVRDFAATAVPLTYTVNSTNDPGAGVCDVTECTLHEAMEAANQHPGPDAIQFAIAPSGVRQTITLNVPLPAILEPLVIDGFTQPGATPNTNATGGLNANVLIDIDGNGQTFGLGLGVGPSTIRGLSLHNFTLAPVAIGNVNAPVHDIAIEGNLIGLTPDGPGPRTEYFGILLLNDVHDIRIGGALPAARNVISNHGSAGIFVTGGEGGTSEVTILGNLIGTTADGATAAPNAVGIARETLGSATGATLRIGGAAPGEGNVISGNETAGILINTTTGPDPAAIVQEILHNDIGLAADGVTALPNVGPGISFLGQPKALVAGNRIAHNSEAGVRVSTTTTPEGFGVTLSQNVIYANGGLPIDLNADGRSANDPLDADAGANDTQNFPAIAAAQALLDGTTLVTGQLDSAPDTSYLVELFAADGTGTPGTTALRFAGSVTVTTDGTGTAAINLPLPGLRAGELLSATATTTATGLTSELSDPLAIAPVPLHTISGTVLQNGAPLANVSIALSGTTTASTTTDASGRYTFAGLPEGGSFTIAPSLANYAFTPPQIEMVGLAADRTADFAATLLIRSRFITEGATGSFWQTTLSLLNPTDAADSVELRYMLSDGATTSQTLAIGPHSHVSIDPAAVPGLQQAAFSTEVRSLQPIVAMRETRWGANGTLGAHAEQAVEAPRESWYFAEGATGCFSLFYLLQNPGSQRAEVDVQFLRRAPLAPVLRHYRLEPHSRTTVSVNDEPELEQAEVAARIQVANGVPILAERSMYSSCAGTTWRGGHSAAASPEPARSWFLAEGATGSFFDLYVLIANFLPGEATVDVTYWLADGTTIVVPHRIPGLSRITIDVAGEDPRLANAEVSTRVTATGGIPVVVERAQWWPHGGWYEGHASAGVTEPGVEWHLAGVALGDPLSAAYALIANTGEADGQVQVRVLFDDGRVQDLAQPLTIRAHSRTTLSLVEGFPDTRGQRFGVIVTSLGATPAPIVVELSSYEDADLPAGRQFWATGTNVVATRVR